MVDVPPSLRGRVFLVIAAGALLVIGSFPGAMSAAQPPPLLTTTATGSNALLTDIGGYQGVIISYNDTGGFDVSAFVYLYLSNAMGQTVYVNVGACALVANQTTQCYVYIPSTVHAGNYTATVFATGATHVPISTSTSITVTL